jgi:hypothetical protein
MPYLILLVFAFVLSVVAALYPDWRQPSIGWLAMACFFAALLFGHAGVLAR